MLGCELGIIKIYYLMKSFSRGVDKLLLQLLQKYK